MPIITHTLTLDPEGPRIPIAIRIYAPEAYELGWRCRYEIDWPDEPKVFYGGGVDELQALVMALFMIGAEIYSTDYHRDGRLRAYETEEGYGFPLAKSLRDMLVGVDAVAF